MTSAIRRVCLLLEGFMTLNVCLSFTCHAIPHLLLFVVLVGIAE